MNNNDSDPHATNPRSPVPEPRIQDIVCHPRINVPEPGLAGDRSDDTPVVMDGARWPDSVPPSALRPGQPCILAPRGPSLPASGEDRAEARPGPGARAVRGELDRFAVWASVVAEGPQTGVIWYLDVQG